MVQKYFWLLLLCFLVTSFMLGSMFLTQDNYAKLSFADGMNLVVCYPVAIVLALGVTALLCKVEPKSWWIGGVILGTLALMVARVGYVRHIVFHQTHLMQDPDVIVGNNWWLMCELTVVHIAVAITLLCGTLLWYHGIENEKRENA